VRKLTFSSNWKQTPWFLQQLPRLYRPLSQSTPMHKERYQRQSEATNIIVSLLLTNERQGHQTRQMHYTSGLPDRMRHRGQMASAISERVPQYNGRTTKIENCSRRREAIATKVEYVGNGDLIPQLASQFPSFPCCIHSPSLPLCS